jgi:dethiobiotin synthetase
MSAVFITATGTDIGKTFVTAGLIRHLRASGREVDALKPVMTGFDPAHPEASDAGVLLTALGRPTTAAEIARISPFRFSAPLSPDMAARRERRDIDFNALTAFSADAAARARGTLLIEGIGGVMVPLNDRHTVLDWMVALACPVILVTGSYLGSLSHALTSIDALGPRSIAIKAVVVNETPGSTVPLTDTVASITRFAAPIPVVALPRLSATDTTHPALAQVAGCFDF